MAAAVNGMLERSCVITSCVFSNAVYDDVQPAVAIVSAAYSIYHHSRDPAARPAASSSAYNTFTAGLDAVIIGLYVFGAVSAKLKSSGWTIRFEDQNMARSIISGMFWTFALAAGFHLVSAAVAFWLSQQFSKIAGLPPDMNPLLESLIATPAPSDGVRREDDFEMRGNGARGHKARLSVATQKSWRSDDED